MYKPSHRAFIPERSLEECLRLWGTIMVRAKDPTHRQFAERIDHQAARPDWEPSPLQLAFILKLVDLYAYDDIALDPEAERLAVGEQQRGQDRRL